MSFLKRMIKDGIREGVSNAIGDAVKGAVEPAATNLANKAAAKIEDVAEKVNAEAAEKQAETKSAFSGLEGAFANLEKAVRQTGLEPKFIPIRGGTDGAQLSFKGLPCPNIFAGGLNFHGRYEFVPIQSMEKAMMVVVKIAELTAR